MKGRIATKLDAIVMSISSEQAGTEGEISGPSTGVERGRGARKKRQIEKKEWK